MFTLVINARTQHFGETATAERHGIARLLNQAAQEIMSGGAPSPLKDSGGHVIGSYSFGAGMICGPGEGFDRTNHNVPSILHGGEIVATKAAPKPAIDPAALQGVAQS